MKSPKAKFLEDKTAANLHADLVTSDVFIKAINAALLQMAFMTTGTDSDGHKAAAAHYKQQGALEFIRILLTLADGQKLPPEKESGNLNWNA